MKMWETQPRRMNRNFPACERDPLDETKSPAKPSAAESKLEASALTTQEVKNPKIRMLSFFQSQGTSVYKPQLLKFHQTTKVEKLLSKTSSKPPCGHRC